MRLKKLIVRQLCIKAFPQQIVHWLLVMSTTTDNTATKNRRHSTIQNTTVGPKNSLDHSLARHLFTKNNHRLLIRSYKGSMSLRSCSIIVRQSFGNPHTRRSYCLTSLFSRVYPRNAESQQGLQKQNLARTLPAEKARVI